MQRTKKEISVCDKNLILFMLNSSLIVITKDYTSPKFSGDHILLPLHLPG